MPPYLPFFSSWSPTLHLAGVCFGSHKPGPGFDLLCGHSEAGIVDGGGQSRGHAPADPRRRESTGSNTVVYASLLPGGGGIGPGQDGMCGPWANFRGSSLGGKKMGISVFRLRGQLLASRSTLLDEPPPRKIGTGICERKLGEYKKGGRSLLPYRQIGECRVRQLLPKTWDYGRRNSWGEVVDKKNTQQKPWKWVD